MSAGRRGVRLDEPERWVFNRVAQPYSARPTYPPELLDELATLAADGWALDLGAGTGLVSLELARRGVRVAAVEPAEQMLDELRKCAAFESLDLSLHHAQAEALPVADASAQLAVAADAVHFFDAERVGLELARTLCPKGCFAVLLVQLGGSPFMDSLLELMARTAPRRPRRVEAQLTQIGSLAGLRWDPPRRLLQRTPLDRTRLVTILRSISFIGPAMSPQLFSSFRKDVERLPGEPEWTRRIELRLGRR